MNEVGLDTWEYCQSSKGDPAKGPLCVGPFLESPLIHPPFPHSFVPCSEKIHLAVTEMASLFPKVEGSERSRSP